MGLGLCFGFLPAIREESIANMANLQFFLVAASFWVLLAIPRTRTGRGLSAAFLVATAASTIVGFVLFPLALLRLLDRRSRMPAVMFLAVQTLHGIVIVIVKPKRQIGIPASLHDVAHTFVYDVLASQFFGGPFGDVRHGRLVLLAIAVVAIISIGLLVVYRPHDARGQLIVAIGALILAGVTYVLEAKAQGTAPRYVVLPAFFTLYGVGIVADVASRLKLPANPARGRRTPSTHRAKVARPLAGVAALAVILSWGLSFSVPSYRDGGPRWSAAYARAQHACHGRQKAEKLPILPVGWTMTLPCSAVD